MSRAPPRGRSLPAVSGVAGFSTPRVSWSSSTRPSESGYCTSRRQAAQSASIGASTRSRRLPVPLPSSLVQVGDRVVDFFDRGGDAPYLLYVYKPSEEYVVRR